MLKMKDIATHAGVSPTTVSFVLDEGQGSSRISEKTRRKVLQSAEELGYRSNGLARAMRTGNTQMFGVLGGNTAEEQVGRMLAGALEAADEQGYTLKLLRLHAFGSAQQVIRRVSELRLMGVVALHLPDAVLRDLQVEVREYKTPLVLMDARSDDRELTQVVSDDEGGIAASVEHLVKLGHVKIAYIGDAKAALGSARKAAFYAAMARHQLPLAADFVQEGNFCLRELSVQAARELLMMRPATRPTAIVCSGDLIALATLQVAHELQVRVPEDISVIGFANLSACEYSIPRLTTIEQPFLEMGRTAVELLLKSIGSKSADAPIPCCGVKVVPTRLIERASTAPPRIQ